MMDQELISIVLILACYLVYRVAIHSGIRRPSDERNVRKWMFDGWPKDPVTSGGRTAPGVRGRQWNA